MKAAHAQAPYETLHCRWFAQVSNYQLDLEALLEDAPALRAADLLLCHGWGAETTMHLKRAADELAAQSQ